jgi:hypothetical protein
MNLISFNINHFVRVRLTDRGRAELRRQHDELNAPRVAAGYPPFPFLLKEVDGWSRWQLHELMQQLGPLCCVGFDPPFETTIVLEAEDA